MKPKIAVVTTARSDYGPSYWLIRDLVDDDRFETSLLVGGSHLSARHGLTVREIEEDGLPIAARIPFVEPTDDGAAAGAGAAVAVREFAARFVRDRYSAIVVYGDRHELLAIATAAVLTRTPIVHLCGGDLTEGVIDEQVRHALTKMAHVHFPSTEASAARVRQMGEEAWRVHCVGDPAIDQFARGAQAGPNELAELLGFLPDRETLLVTFHPATLETDDVARQVGELSAALRDYEGPVVITAPAPDPGGDVIRREWERLERTRPRTYFCESLGSRRYRATLRLVGAIVGNSSSALNEAPCVALPAVNIGSRQKGREAGANVLHCPPDRASIRRALAEALSPAFRTGLAGLRSPYGDGRSAKRIIEVLAQLPPRELLLRKVFQDARGDRGPS